MRYKMDLQEESDFFWINLNKTMKSSESLTEYLKTAQGYKPIYDSLRSTFFIEYSDFDDLIIDFWNDSNTNKIYGEKKC